MCCMFFMARTAAYVRISDWSSDVCSSDGNMAAIASQVRQVGFWIIAAQAGIALALGMPGEAVMGLVGPNFVGGNGALAFLLLAEVVAATAVVSEAALVYVARKRNLAISLATIRSEEHTSELQSL